MILVSSFVALVKSLKLIIKVTSICSKMSYSYIMIAIAAAIALNELRFRTTKFRIFT